MSVTVVAMLLRKPSPIVRRPARLHHHVCRRRRRQESRTLRARQAVASGDAKLGIRERKLEYRLCEVDSHCRSIHFGLLLVALMGVS
jgi:hypothetical protein